MTMTTRLVVEGKTRGSGAFRRLHSANVPLRNLQIFATLLSLGFMGGVSVNSGFRSSNRIGWLFGVGLSLIVAGLMVFVARGTNRSPIVPIMFIVVIMLCARFYGLLAGIIGSVLATVIFALFLFKPYGSFRVMDHQALFNLALLLFAGIALSYANSESKKDAHVEGGTLKPR